MRPSRSVKSTKMIETMAQQAFPEEISNTRFRNKRLPKTRAFNTGFPDKRLSTQASKAHKAQRTYCKVVQHVVLRTHFSRTRVATEDLRFKDNGISTIASHLCVVHLGSTADLLFS